MLKDISEAIFGTDVYGYALFDDASERVIESGDVDEDGLLLEMPDAQLDLCLEDGCYAVASDELPIDQACIIGSKDGKKIGVFLLDDPVNPDTVPEHYALSIPVGIGWKYEFGVDEFYTISELEQARVSALDAPEAGGGPDLDDTPETAPEAAPEAAEEAQYMNDAELLGQDHPDMQELLQRDATFMLGRLYGQKDSRNTQDGKWKAVTLPWLAWLNGQDKGQDSWGFTRHPENKRKEGAAIVLAEAVDGARTDSAIKTMYAIGLDIDSGASMDYVIERLEALGLFAIVYTSHSHGKDELVLKHDDILRKLKLEDSPNRAQIQQYLREFHKDRFDEDFIQSIEIEELRHHTKDGLRTILKTRALDKFRVILPLWEPVHLSDLGATVSQWKEAWADAVTGVAVNMLNVSFDATCTDVNRLFFTPRHPPGAEWYSAVIMGRPLRFEEIEPYPKARYVKERDPGDPFLSGADLGPDNKRERFVTPGGKDLNDWHRKHKERFLIADVLESFCEDKIRVAGGERAGTCHIECPFEHEHSTEGGTATMAMNPEENEAGYWTVFCRHDSCQGRDKLEFLNEMLSQEWFDESLLWDEEWNIPQADQDMDDEETEEAEEVFASPSDEVLAKFNEDSTHDEIRKFLKKQSKLNIDLVERARVVSALANVTILSKAEVRSLWKDVDRELARNADARDDSPREVIPDVDWDFQDQIDWAAKRIHDVNSKNPRLFHYIDGVARIVEDSKGRPMIQIMSELQFRHELNTFMKWVKTVHVGDAVRQIGKPVPKDVYQHFYGGEHSIYPCLRGLVSTPIFVSDGELLTTPGFHAGSGLYYWNENNIDIPKISKEPTKEEVFEAKRLLIEEVFGDFPLGGRTREEIMREGLYGDGIPAVTNLISVLLLMFCRELINGPTPGHLVTKPTPGTGASLLAEVLSLIAYGKVASASQLPANDEEMQKSLLTIIRDGSNIIYFDNIDQSIDSGALASYLTAGEVTGRVLGKTQSVTAEVRAVWLLCGNNVRMSKELLRRLVMIDLDANMESPQKRSGWRHSDIKQYVRDNRGKLVWACLTLIQNWVAKGMKPDTRETLNSFENWSHIMGGILRDAGLGGFLGNRAELEERASDGDDDDIKLFLDAWWDRYMTKPVLVRSTDPKEESLIRMATEQDLQLPVRKTKNMDDELTYDHKRFNEFLGKYEGRVIGLSDGTEVKVTKSPKAGKSGHTWKLEVMHQ